MVEAPYLRKLAISFAAILRPVVSHNSLWYGMLGEDLLCETTIWLVHCTMGIFRTIGSFE